MKEIHFGRQTLEVGEIEWSDEMRELEDRALWSKIRDIIRATFDREIFEGYVKRLRESAWVGVEKPMEAANRIVKHLGLSEEQKSQLLMYFSEKIKYGLINAVASLASQCKNIKEQVKLEEFAGEILQSLPKDLEQLFFRGRLADEARHREADRPDIL